VQVCPGCGESSPDRFTECAFCGTPLAERRETREERKVLTVVFCDLKDSTALGESLDPEALGEVLDLYFTTTTRVLQRHGGSIQKFIGDAVVAAFGIPVAHEDDALRAVRASVEMREALGRLNRQLQAGYGVELETRMGVHTGEVVVRTAVNDQLVLTGDTLNTAARLEQAADAGEILVGAPTYRLVRDAIEAETLEPLELKGKAEPVPAYRLVRVFGDEQSSRRHDAPIVGREEEQRMLLAAFARAARERRCHLTTVFGEAGVGKSRLVRALIEATDGDARVLRGRCLPYGEGITFWPILSIVREACDISTEDPADVAVSKLDAVSDDAEVTRRVASALGWSTEQLPVAELFWGVREMLECLARDQPLVLVIDDVHWAAPTLSELLEHLVETVSDAPILMLCTARPDMLEERPDWSDGLRSHRLVLDRLPDGVASQVIDNLLEGVELPAEIRSVVIRASEGNPLFVEQLVSMLIESGVLVEVDGSWSATRSLAQLEIPPSISALLTARLDLLAPEERAVVEPASVIGLEFPSIAVGDLVQPSLREQVGAHLEAMTRKQLVRPSPDGERQLDDHRFHHLLIRDAAYQRSLKRARAELHERFAGWLEHFDEDHSRPGEHDEIVGYHLEQAFTYRGQLGPSDEHANELGGRAARKLAAAGRRAFARGDLPAAVNLLSRARDVLPVGDPMRLAVLPDLAEAMMEGGDFDGATATTNEAEESSVLAHHEPEVLRSRLVRLLVDLYAGSDEGWAERVRDELTRALPTFQRTEHHVGQATAWRLRYTVDGSALDWAGAFRAAEEIVHHAEAADDVRQQRRGALGLAMAALHGPTPVTMAVERCLELIGAVEGDRQTHAVIQLSLAQLTAMRGDFDSARRLVSEARGMLSELGQSMVSASTAIDAALVEIMAGDLVAAERLLRQDLESLEEIGETYLRSTVAGLLARVLVLQGRYDEAEPLAMQVNEIAAPDDIDAQVLWRSCLARCRSQQGRLEEALDLANEAVTITEPTTDTTRSAEALTDRAAVLAATGRTDDAMADLHAALGILVAKGDEVGAANVRAAVRALTAATPSS
jgi:class 3 adenylate cyclase/tetratricopeptide (TPR) repeat protein